MAQESSVITFLTSPLYRFYHDTPHPLKPPGATLSYGNRLFSPLHRNEKKCVDTLFNRDQFLMRSW
jgi:hypothetical protein